MASSWRNLVEFAFKCPMLTREKERELFLLWRDEGDEEARKELINSHLRLVLSIACQHANKKEITREELVIELFEAGLSGFVSTIDRTDKGRFDPDHPSKARLATYARYKIETSITNTLQGWQREKRRDDALSSTAPTISVETVILKNPEAEDGITILDTLPTDGKETWRVVEEDVIRELDHPKVLNVVHGIMEKILSPRERTILQERLGDEEVELAPLGRQFGVSPERIRQIEAEAYRKIQRQLRVFHPRLWKAMAVC